MKLFKGEQMKRVLIAVQTNQDENIFKEYLKCLNNLIIPEGYEVHKHFILHNSENLIKLLDDTTTYEVFNDNSFFNISNETHEWKVENFNAVVYMKNKIIEKVLKEDYDYWFLVDSDVLLQPKTLKHLLEQDKDMIATTYITEWIKGSGNFGFNFWTDEYNGIENTEQFFIKGVYKVGGTGACCLYSKRLLEKTKNVSPIPYLKVSQWEDKSQSIKAIFYGFDIYVSTHYPALHLYRQEIYEDYINGKIDFDTFDFTKMKFS